MALRPQLQRLANQHADVIAAASEQLPRLTDIQLRWKPAAKHWSIAEIADHLVRVHAATNPRFQNALAAAPPAGDEVKIELPYSLIDRLFARVIAPGKIKVPVPPRFAPSVPPDSTAAIAAELKKQLEDFARILTEADTKQLRGLHVTSPAAEGLRPTIVAYLDASVQHNRYHWVQIDALRNDPGFPKP